MAQQLIGIGTTANDGTGDPLRSAFDKSNDNFTELYGKPDLSLATNTLTLTKADGTTDTVDLAPYLDEDARAIASGTINGSGIVTFTRDDATTFTLDLSSLLDDTNLVTSVNTQVGAVVLDSDDIAEGSTNLYDQTVTLTASTGMSITGTYPDFTIASVIQGNATHTGDVTGATALTIANDVIDYANMGAEFTTAAVISASDVDFSSAAVFTKTLSANTTLTFSNVSTGMVKDLVITGDFTLTLPASVKTITGTYDGTVSNLIQIVSTNGSTEQWATISQEA